MYRVVAHGTLRDGGDGAPARRPRDRRPGRGRGHDRRRRSWRRWLRLRPGVRPVGGRRPHVCGDGAGRETCSLTSRARVPRARGGADRREGDRMPLHPTAEMMIQVLNDTGLTFTARHDDPRIGARPMIAATTNPAFPKHPVHDVADRTIPGPAGPIPVRVYRPSARRPRCRCSCGSTGAGGSPATSTRTTRSAGCSATRWVPSSSRSTTASHPRPSIPPRPTTAWPRTNGRLPTPTRSTPTRRGSRSVATARAAILPRSSRCARATRGCRNRSSSCSCTR